MLNGEAAVFHLLWLWLQAYIQYRDWISHISRRLFHTLMPGSYDFSFLCCLSVGIFSFFSNLEAFSYFLSSWMFFLLSFGPKMYFLNDAFDLGAQMCWPVVVLPLQIKSTFCLGFFYPLGRRCSGVTERLTSGENVSCCWPVTNVGDCFWSAASTLNTRLSLPLPPYSIQEPMSSLTIDP